MEDRPSAPAVGHTDDWPSRTQWLTSQQAGRVVAADKDGRPRLTRERVVAEALAVIARYGVHALTMRTVAARLGVVPGALYRHVRNKEQLDDLVLDAVLAEVACRIDPSMAWPDEITVLAHRLRAVLERHPGVAALLKTRDPLGPHSLPLAEAFLAPLHAARLADCDAGLAFSLIVDYTTGFAVGSTHTSVPGQRVRDMADRTDLHAFLRSLPSDRFPALVALGEHVWVDNRDERFTTGLDILVSWAASRAPARPEPRRRRAVRSRSSANAGRT